jgi:hypothetical protein
MLTKAEGFTGFLRRHDIGIVVLDPVLKEYVLYRDDPEFLAFLRAPEQSGFVVVPTVPGLVSLAVRRDLLDGPH